MATQSGSDSTGKVFTIGHSNHPTADFLELLAKHRIDVLVDIRSSPFSKFAPHFNKDNLNCAVTDAGRNYLFLGRELGGKPKESTYYDEERRVLYWKLAESPLFEQGIERLRYEIASHTVALLCSEENPWHCHRRLLVGRVLLKAGVGVFHIRGNGTLQTESELELANKESTEQMSIFPAASEDEPWRSIQSALPRKPQPNSSKN